MTGEDAMVSASDIARLADVGRAAVSNWRRRFDDFPEPAGGTASSPLFPLSEVEEWLALRGKNVEVSPGDRIWQQLRTTGDDLRLGDMVCFLGTFILYLQRDPDGWRALAREGGHVLRGRLPAAIASAVPELSTSLPEDIDPGIVRQVAELIEGQGHIAAFDFIYERYVETHARRLLVTPCEVAELMVQLTGISGGSVLDPACGLGTLLAAASDADLLLGQEIGEAPARITLVRLLLRGRAVQVATGDSLRADAFPGVRADGVVCNPPFGERGWGFEELSSDPRWEYGFPPRGEPELAWLQHCLAHVEQGGRVVIMMPAAAASRRSGRRIRSNLLRAGALRAVITVTPGAGASSRTPDLWVLQRPARGERPPFHILMVDASEHLSIAAPAWAAFSADPDGAHDLSDRCRAVPLVHFLDDDVDLSPGRYLGQRAGPGADYVQLAERLRSATDVVAGAVPDISRHMRGDEVPMTTVGELIKAGVVALFQAPVKPGSAGGDLPVLTAKDVRVGRPPSGQATRTPEAVVTEPGDVVVPVTASHSVARVLREGGALLGPQLYLFRVDPDRVDPDALAGFIRISCSSGLARVSATSIRIDPRRAQVPRIPVEDQQRYGDAFRRLAALEEALNEAHALGEQTVRAGFDGLADGSLHP